VDFVLASEGSMPRLPCSLGAGNYSGLQRVLFGPVFAVFYSYWTYCAKPQCSWRLDKSTCDGGNHRIQVFSDVGASIQDATWGLFGNYHRRFTLSSCLAGPRWRSVYVFRPPRIRGFRFSRPLVPSCARGAVWEREQANFLGTASPWTQWRVTLQTENNRLQVSVVPEDLLRPMGRTGTGPVSTAHKRIVISPRARPTS